MNWKGISRNVGLALLVSSLFMLLSVLTSVLNGNDSACAALIISFTITYNFGNQQPRRRQGKNDGDMSSGSDDFDDSGNSNMDY